MPVHVLVMSLEMAPLSSWSLAGESVSSYKRFDMEGGVSYVRALELIVGEAESFPSFIDRMKKIVHNHCALHWCD